MTSAISRGLAASLVAALSALSTQPALAAGPSEKWKANYQKVESDLRAGNWAEAEKAAAALFKETVDQYAARGGADRPLVMITMMRAIAEQGLGRTAEASWHWHMAAGILPELTASQAALAPYGEPAKALLAAGQRAAVSAKEVEYRKDGPIGDTTGLTAPKAEKDPSPRIPLRMKDEGGFYVVEILVGVDGSPNHPVTLRRRGPVALELLALEKMREWKFKPATRAGEAVEVPYLVGLGLGVGGGGGLTAEEE